MVTVALSFPLTGMVALMLLTEGPVAARVPIYMPFGISPGNGRDPDIRVGLAV